MLLLAVSFVRLLCSLFLSPCSRLLCYSFVAVLFYDRSVGMAVIGYVRHRNATLLLEVFFPCPLFSLFVCGVLLFIPYLGSSD